MEFRVLLTGTPIQNNLQEIYSLLNFIQPSIFTAEEIDVFVKSYSNVRHQPALGMMHIYPVTMFGLHSAELVISLKNIIWYLLLLYLYIENSERNQHWSTVSLCLCFQLLSCRVSWSLSCFVESSQRSLSICRRRRSCWCTMACRRCRRNATEPFWWRTWVRVCEL